jgi:hypothetical protein
MLEFLIQNIVIVYVIGFFNRLLEFPWARIVLFPYLSDLFVFFSSFFLFLTVSSRFHSKKSLAVAFYSTFRYH